MRRLTARKWIYPSKNNKILTSLGFFRRCWTIVRRNSSWDIWIPLMRSSCSESAKNMQFPSPWLSEIAKPFFNAVVFKACVGKRFCDFWQSRRGKLHVFWTFRAAWPHQRNSNVPWWVTPNYCSASSGKPQAGKYLIIFAWLDSFASRKPSHLPALLLRL